MPAKKISALTSITGANVDAAADVLPIVDTSAAATKKITVAELLVALAVTQSDGADFSPNLTITAARAGNAETIALKTKAGTDPTAADPIKIGFRDAALTTGGYTMLTLSAAISLVIPSTATMGATSAVPFRLWLVLFNDAGTARLGLVNTSLATSIFGLKDDVLRSATLMDTASDNAGVIYAGAAVSSKAMRVLGYIDYTLTTAGTWANAPTQIQVYGKGMKLPGDVVAVQWTETGAVATGTTQIPNDDTIPQITEGDEYMTVAITPQAAANRLLVEVSASLSAAGTAAHLIAALFQDAVANALAAIIHQAQISAGSIFIGFQYTKLAGSTSSITFRFRAGPAAAITLTFNGSNAVRQFGGVIPSRIKVTELMG